jgi:hypothetical protein
MTRFGASVVTVALVFAVAGPAAAQTTLRYQFKEGEKLEYVLDQKMKTTGTVAGKPTDAVMNQEATMTWHVLKVDADGSAKINIKFGRSKMSMEGPMGKVEIDSESAKEPDDPLGRILYGMSKGLASLEIAAKFSPTGQASDIQLPENAAKLLRDLPGAEFFGDSFSPEGMKRLVGQAGVILPKEPVDKGAKWKNTSEMKLAFVKLGVELNYVYQGPATEAGRRLEKATFDPKLSVDPDPNAQVVFKLKKQENSGTLLFDNAAGKLINVTMNLTLDGEVEFMGQAINRRIVHTAVTRLVEKK